MSATQRALRMPEIVSSIILHLDAVWSYHSRRRAHYLFCCLLVNKLWYREAVWYLWRHICFGGVWIPVDHYFQPIAPERRQFYADLVEATSLHYCYKYKNKHPDLDGLIFPRLTSLAYYTEVAFEDVGYPPPAINAPRLKHITWRTCTWDC
ncbi:hypothetical protein P170DRAFT_438199 [Aspergillus steynii IBT 23096]|uniref:F-box domain-containing protein n=1 Tax=Aspergillus steynii IBT 23096 TaxID=1392250 RepID=A0A2I2G0I0_9EURO|nr:uncharacterized protein P170DRAFT_438199 [Aspergillus steynii IBT 23096]PLB46394.1 hypothetical protein P170DRAFT_438199 [Aspergillus steynii IBT 23096]